MQKERRPLFYGSVPDSLNLRPCIVALRHGILVLDVIDISNAEFHCARCQRLMWKLAV